MVREPFMVDQASPEKETRDAIRHHKARDVALSSLQHGINQVWQCMYATFGIQEVKVGEPEIQDHSQIDSEFEAILGYMRWE